MSFFGGFGSAAPAPAPSGFSFGAPAPAAPAPSFGFGQQQQQPAAPAPAAGGFGFGQQQQQQAPAPAPTRFSFDAAPAAPAPAFSFAQPSAAPAAPAPFSFGAAAPAPAASLWAGAPAAAAPAAGFGFGAAAPAQQAPTAVSELETALVTLRSAYTDKLVDGSSNPGCKFKVRNATAYNNPNCKKSVYCSMLISLPLSIHCDVCFVHVQHLMYNTVEPSQKHLYQRPPFIEQSLWEQAERDNQEPDDCVPYPVVGFQALVDRLKSQQEHAVSVKDKAKVCVHANVLLINASFVYYTVARWFSEFEILSPISGPYSGALH
jgi:Nucleoporin complex subunit 54